MNDENLTTPIESNEEVFKKSNEEKILKIIANILLFLGIVATVVCAFTITYTNIRAGFLRYKEISEIGIAITIGVFIFSILVWAFLRVICNISNNLKELNEKNKIK